MAYLARSSNDTKGLDNTFQTLLSLSLSHTHTHHLEQRVKQDLLWLSSEAARIARAGLEEW